MIIRKPYAFLIKHFKKIHILLLLLAVFIYYKSVQTYSFTKEFISLGTYDYINESISGYTSIISLISILVLIIINFIIVRLLKRKEKPWKLYLVPTIQYIVIFLSFIMIRNYFHSYTGIEGTTQIRIWRDLLGISQITQLSTFVICLIRIFGVDLQKFNFKLDEEYLELEQKDREELEININIDKASFKRMYKKAIRNINYFYQEHKLFSRIVIVIFILLFGRSSIRYINNHKSYKQGNEFNVSGYTVKVNNSYYTDKAYNGDVISDKSGFVIIDITIKNNVQERTPNLNRYHIMNGTSNYTTTAKTYAEEFKDLGKAYDSISLKRDKSVNMIMIYKVNKKLNKNKYVLYYQEMSGNTKYLRKIKLKLKDLSNIEEKEQLQLGDTLHVDLIDDEENIILEDYELKQSTEYVYRNCQSNKCTSNKVTYNAPNGYKILEIPFGSDMLDGKEMAKFVENYVKITYTDSEGKEKTIDAVDAIDRTYYGKRIYLKVPQELENSKTISLNFTIRNNKYVYKIK